MLSNLGRFAAALMRRRSAWLGFVMLVLPPAERLVYAKMLPAEDDVWLSIAGALLLLWAAFRAWEEQPSANSLENDPPPVQPKRRSLTSDQRVALLGALKNSGEPFRIILVYHHLNHETEEYANQFSAALSPERFAGDAIPTDDLPADLEGVVVRVQRFSTMPVGAQRLVDALTAAGIDHRGALVTGQRAALAPSDYFDLAIGRMK
jgi:hypothetical protein